jgi:hypothetical protein
MIPQNNHKSNSVWITPKIDLVTNKMRIATTIPKTNPHGLLFRNAELRVLESVGYPSYATDSNVRYSFPRLLQ